MALQGGARHASLASLRAWAGGSEAAAAALAEFLANGAEVPEATRRWPAWRRKWVPRIVAALCGRGGDAAGGPRAAVGGGGRAGVDEAVREAGLGAEGGFTQSSTSHGEWQQQQQQQQQDWASEQQAQHEQQHEQQGQHRKKENRSGNPHSAGETAPLRSCGKREPRSGRWPEQYV